MTKERDEKLRAKAAELLLKIDRIIDFREMREAGIDLNRDESAEEHEVTSQSDALIEELRRLLS